MTDKNPFNDEFFIAYEADMYHYILDNSAPFFRGLVERITTTDSYGDFTKGMLEIYDKDCEYIKRLGEQYVNKFIEYTKLFKLKKLTEKQINFIANYVTERLLTIIDSFYTAYEDFAKDKDKVKDYESSWNAWVHIALPNRIEPLIRILEIEINKYNAEPQDWWSSNKKTIYIAAATLILGWLLGQLKIL